MACLALALWPLGEIESAVSLIARMLARMASLTHVTTLAIGNSHAAQFAMLCGDLEEGEGKRFGVREIGPRAQSQPVPALSRCFSKDGRGPRTTRCGGLEDMRRSAEFLREQKVLFLDGLMKIALAEAEAQAGDPDRAVTTLDNALATCESAGLRQFEAELHRARGEILLKRNPANAAPAEEAFLTAIAIAKQQGTRSFELRAALARAKLYQSDRPPPRGPRRPRARARRLLADARNAGDRRRAGPARAFGVGPLRAVKPARAQKERRLWRGLRSPAAATARPSSPHSWGLHTSSKKPSKSASLSSSCNRS